MIQQEQQKREYWLHLNQKMQALGMSEHEQDRVKAKIVHDEAVQLRE